MMDLIEKRNADFLAAAKRVCRNSPYPLSAVEVAHMAALSPAPCYYVTYDYAQRVLCLMRHGRLRLRNDRRLAMFREIDAKVRRCQASHPGMRPGHALTLVLAGASASQFFIHPGTALNLLRELNRT